MTCLHRVLEGSIPSLGTIKKGGKKVKTRFRVGDEVKFKPGRGPARYNDRVGDIIGLTKKGARTRYLVSFFPRRQTPFEVPASDLNLW